MAACCIPDFKARKRFGDLELRDIYLATTTRSMKCVMVNHAAPRVSGATLAGGPYDLLHGLAAPPDPHRRRTAMTAPLWFVRYGSDADVLAGLAIVEVLHPDPDPLVTKRLECNSHTAATGCRNG